MQNEEGSQRYRVLYGWQQWQDFGRWDDALAFWATKRDGEIRNIDRMDNDSSPDGLTEEQRAQVGL